MDMLSRERGLAGLPAEFAMVCFLYLSLRQKPLNVALKQTGPHKLKTRLIKIHWILSSQLGLDPMILFRSLRGLPVYLRDWVSFRKNHKGKMKFMPCLHDRYEEAGATKSEYFWQDFLVARAIHEARPVKHVDVGSRIDGFAAHVASFREIEIFDVRRVTMVIPGMVFRVADLMNPVTIQKGYCDSLSCLHAIEHFGLGRYGDPINPLGYQLGIANMAQLLQPHGTFYLSTPIGRERVEFNANWVFDPRSIVRCAESNGLTLQKLIVITSANGYEESAYDEETFARLAARHYQLGLFIFKKTR